MRLTLDVRRRVVSLVASLAALASTGLASTGAQATPAIVMDAATGDVLYQQDAAQPWYPASTTKLMTVYVALSAVRDHRIAMDTPLVVSARAHKMPPSKMGFPVGSQVTLDNALKMLMVKSANDIAITIAEGISGSVEAFAEDMNQAGAQIGLRESHFVNPNGLPDPEHVSSARDMALIARALYEQFPDQAALFNIGTLQLGREMINNHNNLLGRYPGADGMKTGFTCAAGFNVVATAYRNGRRIVVVVMGAPSVAARTAKVAALFDRAFAGIDRPSYSVVALPPASAAGPVDMHDGVCRNRGPLIAQFNAEVEQLDAALAPPSTGLGLGALNPERAFLFNTQNVAAPTTPTALFINTLPPPAFAPVPVHIGAEDGYSGVVAQARAPHSAIGSEPAPVTATAYAPAPDQGAGASPLGVDATALPMHGRRTKAAQAKRGRVHMKAAAEAPVTKVISDNEGGPPEPAAKAGPTKGAKAVAAKKPAARSREASEGDGAPKTKKPVLTKPALKKAAAKPTASKKAAAPGSPKVKAAAKE